MESREDRTTKVAEIDEVRGDVTDGNQGTLPPFTFEAFKAWLNDYVSKGSNIMTDELYTQVQNFLKTDSHKGSKGQCGDAKFRHSVRKKKYHLVTAPELNLFDAVFTLNDDVTLICEAPIFCFP